MFLSLRVFVCITFSPPRCFNSMNFLFWASFFSRLWFFFRWIFFCLFFSYYFSFGRNFGQFEREELLNVFLFKLVPWIGSLQRWFSFQGSVLVIRYLRRAMIESMFKVCVSVGPVLVPVSASHHWVGLLFGLPVFLGLRSTFCTLQTLFSSIHLLKSWVKSSWQYHTCWLMCGGLFLGSWNLLNWLMAKHYINGNIQLMVKQIHKEKQKLMVKGRKGFN